MNTINQDAAKVIEMLSNTEKNEFHLILDDFIGIQEIDAKRFNNDKVLPCKSCGRVDVCVQDGLQYRYVMGCPECMNPKSNL